FADVHGTPVPISGLQPCAFTTLNVQPLPILSGLISNSVIATVAVAGAPVTAAVAPGTAVQCRWTAACNALIQSYRPKPPTAAAQPSTANDVKAQSIDQKRSD